jgi:predicted O-methyltransferase YrrM
MALDPDRPVLIDPRIAAYVAAHTTSPDDVLVELRDRTARLGAAARMQISADQGALLTLLTRLAGARQAIEVGTFTGYSAICIARGLAPGGRLLCCDVSEEYTAIAREAWTDAGVDDRIELRIGPALDTLRALAADPKVDLAFIDADKSEYTAYYEELIGRMRPGGLIVVDNTLWSGRVVDGVRGDATTDGIRRFNDVIVGDVRVESYILPVSDGMTLIVKR